MKRIIIYTLVIFCGFVSSCGDRNSRKKELVKEFAENFVEKVSNGDLESLKSGYRDILKADSIVSLKGNQIDIKETSTGNYDVIIDDDVILKVKVNDEGKIKVIESYGLFAYPSEKVRAAKHSGIWNEELSDVKQYRKMRDLAISSGNAQNDKVANEENESRYKEKLANAQQRVSSPTVSGPKGVILSSPSVEKNGKYIHNYKGYFTDGKTQWPIKLDFVEENGTITTALYKNVNYKAESTMTVSTDGSDLVLNGKAGGSPFSIRLSPSYGDGWSGYATTSKNTLDVYVEPS